MNKESYIFFLVATFLALLFVSCSNDDAIDSNEGVPVPVRFNTGCIGVSGTKTTVDRDGITRWKQNDSIGLFMFAHDEGLDVATIIQSADNIEYKALNDGKSFTVGDADQTIYYPTINLGDKFDFLAYYPFTSLLDQYSYPLDVSDQTDESKIDVLYALANNKGKGYDNSSEAVFLPFTHVLSRLNFTILPGEGYHYSDLEGLTVMIHGMVTTGKLDLTTGTVDVDTDGDVGTLILKTAPEGNFASSIVIPQFTSASLEVKLLGGKVYRLYLPPRSFEGGIQYTYEVTIID